MLSALAPRFVKDVLYATVVHFLAPPGGHAFSLSVVSVGRRGAIASTLAVRHRTQPIGSKYELLCQPAPTSAWGELPLVLQESLRKRYG